MTLGLDVVPTAVSTMVNGVPYVVDCLDAQGRELVSQELPVQRGDQPSPVTSAPAADSTSPIGPAESSREVDVGTRETGQMGHRVSCPEFVGRAEELDLLGAAFDAVADGRAMTVIVGGDAGVGKTRLVEEFCERARARGAVTAAGVCVPTDGGLPYGPVVGILRDLVRQLGESTVADIFSPLTWGLGSGGPGLGGDMYSTVPRMADELAKTRLFESILTCFTRLAERSVMVLVFEDLHWADSASAELLSFLTRNLGDTRVLLIDTYRSEELGRDHPLRPWLGELSRHVRVTPLHLEGLDRDEMVRLIEGIVGQQPEWALVEAVWARSQGNPFFAEELTAARHSPSLSAELQGVIMTRVAALGKEAQQLLRVAATVGVTAEYRLLAAVGGLDTDSLDGALAETVDKQILVVDSSREGYRFRHALLREAVYEALLPGERSRLHRQVATALTADASLGPPGPGHREADLAGHWWAAGEWAEALGPSISAAEAAADVFAFSEALAYLEHALSALERVPTAAASVGIDRLELLERAASAAYLAGEARRSVDLARAAIDRVDAASDPVTAARYYTLLGRGAWASRDSEAAFDAYRKAAALLPAVPPSAELAMVLAEEARCLMLLSRYRDAELRCHEAIAAAQAVGARREEGHARNTLGCCRGSLGQFDEGIGLVQEALQIAEELASPDDLDRAYGNLSFLLEESGRLEEAASMVFDSAGAGEKLWGVRWKAVATNSTDALVRLGRYNEAAALLAQIGDHLFGVSAADRYLLPAPMAIRCGRFDEAERLVAAAGELTSGLSDVQLRGQFHMLSAELALEQDRPDDAHDQVERALAQAAGTDDEAFAPEMCVLGIRALADRVDAGRASGRRVDADKAHLLALGLVQEIDRLVAAPGERGGQPAPRVKALACQGAAEASRLDQPDPDLWRAAVSLWDEAHEPYPAAYCAWREAEALLEGRAGRSRADACLQQAWQTSKALGVLPLMTRVERLAQRARIPLREADTVEAAHRSTLADDLGLTPREVEVLGQLAAGRTDREIAEALFISKKTASVHVSNLLRKLDVANRVEAGRVGQAHGLS
jgi:DNA-binding CsgD family transcriptional regulator